MAEKKLTVVVSQSQSKNPAKRELEEQIAAELMMDREIDASVIPHLYDIPSDHTAMMFLRSIPGDLVILSWMYPRATRWILDRNGVKGHPGQHLLTGSEEEEEDDEDDDQEDEQEEARGVGAINVPDRKIYCIDLRNDSEAQSYLDEIRRIAGEKSVQTVDLMQWIQGNPKQEQLERYLNNDPSSQTSASSDGQGVASEANAEGPEKVKRRWYPVIDYDRCTNCMECIDFCLFGVYGVDENNRILVEEQDNCKKGCPACSRVCPENAIIFPGHKSPAIAGADGEIGGLKIDLSKLFGGQSALEVAAQERDAELVRDGRDAVGMSVGIPKRQEGKQHEQRDEMDDLMDDLDKLDL